METRWLKFGTLVLGIGLLQCTISGCGLRIPSDAGTVIEDEADYPGAGKPYPLPELDVSTEDSKAVAIPAAEMPEPSEQGPIPGDPG